LSIVQSESKVLCPGNIIKLNQIEAELFLIIIIIGPKKDLGNRSIGLDCT